MLCTTRSPSWIWGRKRSGKEVVEKGRRERRERNGKGEGRRKGGEVTPRFLA